ncbi:MAG TPA: alpha/beta hydrolase [Terrimesophilobacter sp.]|uniref:alpha/beta fold hydrolase n=1 Tax=Terrimesophilobacter sp. TaxID=2906435 RepID=UPI002F92DCE5
MPSAVVLVHGLRTSATMWRHQIESLQDRNIPVTAIDLPGHGRRMGERFTLENALETIGDAVATASGEGSRPYLCGFSLGGYLSIEWAAQNPGAISGLLAASCGTTPNRAVLEGWRILARGIHALPDRGRGLNDFMVRMFVPRVGAEDVLAGGVALEVMDDVLRALRPVKPVRSLARIGEPVLFVNGRLDHFRLDARRYLAAAANGRLVTVSGATHMVSLVKPDRFTQLLLDGYAEAGRITG